MSERPADESVERMEEIECSPDGRWVAGGSWDSRLYVWDARSLALVHRSDRIGGQVMALAWSPDSERVAVAGGSVVRRWALASAAMIVVGLVCWFAGLYNA